MLPYNAKALKDKHAALKDLMLNESSAFVTKIAFDLDLERYTIQRETKAKEEKDASM